MTVISALGLMSGTSLDGIDVALIQTDGDMHVTCGPARTYPYDATMQAQLADATQGKGDLCLVEDALTRHHAEAVTHFMRAHDLSASEISLIGFHGQTVSHRPDEGLTHQLGNGALLATMTDIPVMCDFRRHDVAAGGQGAPLAPVYHLALTQDLPHPVAVVNVGGISNITYIPTRNPEDMLAFDTGTGNALLNQWVEANSGLTFDENGRFALEGVCNEGALASLLEHSYFTQPPPKSLDRHSFSLKAVEGLSLQDGAATLSEFTVRGIMNSAQFLPELPASWVITGGGRLNNAIMTRLNAHSNTVMTAEQAGWDGDALEAQAFAYLAVRSQRGLPLSWPGTTGVSRAVTGGAFYRAANVDGR